MREDRIVDALQACHGNDAARLATVQQALGCGTQCGSCVPALQALVRRTPPTPTLEAEAA